MTHTTIRSRAAGAALITGAVIFFLAEFIAAAAWTNPPYSYTYHYISNLGVHGPLEVLGQFMYSPLAWVMNTGFFVFGITIAVGVALLEGLHGWRRWLTLCFSGWVAVGGVLLAFHPGTGDPVDGSVDYHGLGAFASIVGGNLLVILLGRLRHDAGLESRTRATLVVLGSFGLVSLLVFLAVAGSGANILVGFTERAAVYPILVGLICAGVSIRKHRTLDALEHAPATGV